ncbi:MAG: hypothetical protein WKG01_24245 [Kofleriaceae bacterium]
MTIAPLVWRGRFVPERRTLRAGDALRLGGAGEAIPGLVTWDVLAPNAAVAMLAIPIDPTQCAAWTPIAGAARRSPAGCEVLAGAFELAAHPLVPDAGAVLDRAARAAFAIGTPALLLLLVVLGSPRRARRAGGVGRALRLATVSGGLAALIGWRLTWAYRIDMLRELAVGVRTADNELAAVAIGAALAGTAVLALDALTGQTWLRRAAAAFAGWAAWLTIGWLVIGLELELTPVRVGVLGLSGLAASMPLLSALTWSRLRLELVLGAIATLAVVAHAAHSRSALVKLGLAYATVLAGHAVVRTLLAHATSWPRRLRVGAMLAGAALCVAMLDTGVTLAIVGVGLAIAMLVAGHDAMYEATHASQIGLLEREHARLLAVHGLATIALAVGVAIVALAASERALIEYGAIAILHVPLLAASMFGLAALVARTHRRSWTPWLAAALAALAIWGMRESILARVTAGDGTASDRVAAVIDPGYALLRDDRAFAANASAWREATLATEDADRWSGQGYFGARIRDPGVSRSVDNDYLPVLIARETGVGGLVQTVALLLAIIVGAAVIAAARLRHASREHRARALVCAVAGSLVVYQPLAAVGILPLTGISWPGLGIDSPADLWLFVIGLVWCVMAGRPGRRTSECAGRAGWCAPHRARGTRARRGRGDRDRCPGWRLRARSRDRRR